MLLYILFLSIHHLPFLLGPDKGAYYHELFLRGKPLLAENIRRSKGKSDKLKACEEEPNFYSLPPLPSYTFPRTSEPAAPRVPMNRPEGSVFADLATSFAASRYHLQHAIQETSSTMDPGQRVESQPSATQRQDLFTSDLCRRAAHSLAHNGTLVRERKRNAEMTQPSSIKPHETPSTLQRLLGNQTGVTPFALGVGHIEAKESPRHQNQCVTTTGRIGVFLRQQYHCGNPVAGQERQQQGNAVRSVDRRSPSPPRPFEESFPPSVNHFLKKKGFRHENQVPGQQHKEHYVKDEQSPGVRCETFCAADLEPTPLGVEARMGGQISLSSSKTNRDLYQFQEIFGAGGGISEFTNLKPATTLSSSSPMALDHSNIAGLRQFKFARTADTSSLVTREACDGPGLANRQTGFQRDSNTIGECIADSRASFGQL